MQDELSAIERQNMLEHIKQLQSTLKDMESDFAKFVKGISPCFFCANDETCECYDSRNCDFKWKPHD